VLLGAWSEAILCTRGPLRELTVIEVDHADATVLLSKPARP
jgi:hypothetical protein